jgi:hypothetical protein
MAQLVQGGGLQGRWPLAGAEAHLHLGLQLRLALFPLHQHQRQLGTAVAGTAAA